MGVFWRSVGVCAMVYPLVLSLTFFLHVCLIRDENAMWILLKNDRLSILPGFLFELSWCENEGTINTYSADGDENTNFKIYAIKGVVARSQMFVYELANIVKS